MKLKRLFQLMKQFFDYSRTYGLKAAIQQALKKVIESRMDVLSKKNIFTAYSFITSSEFGPSFEKGAYSSKTINWVIPPFSKGSGGHLNIFRFVSFLEKMGYECRIVIMGDLKGRSSQEMRSQIGEWFFPIQATVYIGIENAPPAFHTIATSWQTAYDVRRFNSTMCKYYFVQDFEPWFYSQGSEYAFAEETYCFGFTGITAGTWLADKLRDEYGMKTFAVGFSCEHEIYQYKPKSIEERGNRKRRVFFYARPPTPRRAFELGMLALRLVSEKLPDLEVVFAGWDLSGFEIPFAHESLGVANIVDLPRVYNSCDVALVLSFSNLSLLPLELMACGVPVVSNSGPWSEWLLNSRNSILARPTPDALAQGLLAVLGDSVLSDSLRHAGLKTAASSSWESEASKMAAVFFAAESLN
jgi:glycosyltransferase involved in cell wall biosynthesis